MGAWDSGNFENDAVCDWLADLSDWTAVQSALAEVMYPSEGVYVGADLCCIALGAAEIVAACMGRPGKIPSEAAEFARMNREHCDEPTRALAEACTRKIDAQSELQILFDEGGTNELWHGHLEELLRRLSSAN